MNFDSEVSKVSGRIESRGGVLVCPLCGWYDVAELGSQVVEHKDGLDDRSRLRLRIFLEDWVGTDESSASIRWCRCEGCGFVYFLPRPTSEMVAVKYHRLSTRPLRQPPFPGRVDYVPEAWRKLKHQEVYVERSRELFELLSPRVGAGARILDFGGAQGAILERFVQNGFDCHVVDYGCRNPLPGLLYRGPTLDGVSREYDIAVCNHVLEHVADPVSELLSVREALVDDGIVFAEVPLELWNKDHPKPAAPVTHINWFSVPSLRYCLEAAGFDVLTVNYCSFRTYVGTKGLAVRAVGRKAGVSTERSRGSAETRREVSQLKDIQRGRIGALIENFVSLPASDLVP